jgi:hypothetical protein
VVGFVVVEPGANPVCGTVAPDVGIVVEVVVLGTPLDVFVVEGTTGFPLPSVLLAGVVVEGTTGFPLASVLLAGVVVEGTTGFPLASVLLTVVVVLVPSKYS